MAPKKAKKPPETPEERRQRLLKQTAQWGEDVQKIVLMAPTPREMVAAVKRVSEEHQRRLASSVDKLGRDLVRILREAGVDIDTRQEIKTDTYMRLVTPMKHASDDLQKSLRDTFTSTENKARHITDIKQEVLAAFQREGVMQVTYDNGRKVSLDTHVAMVARTEHTETQSITAIKQAEETDTNYVYVPKCVNGCKLCGQKSDRVYCIDPSKGNPLGALPVYGSLYEGRYHTIHPNCRCIPSPYYPELDPDEEATLKRSKRKQNVDARTEQDRRAYAYMVTQQRRMLAEFREYNAVKARLGDGFPYKSLGGFRRAWREYGEKHGSHRGFWESKGARVREVAGDAWTTPPYNSEVVDSPAYLAKFNGLTKISGVRKKIIKAARRCIKMNNGKSTERCVAIDLNDVNKNAMFFRGGISHVNIQPGAFNGGLKDTLIFIHNHPHSGSFSPDDIAVLNNFPCIKTMIAVGHDGTVYRLSIGDGERIPSLFDSLFKNEYNRIYEQFNDTHETMVILAKKYGWRYEKL